MESVSAVNDSVLLHQESLGYFSSRSTAPAVHPYYTFQLVILEHQGTLGGSDVFSEVCVRFRFRYLLLEDIGRAHFKHNNSFTGLDL